MQAPNDISLLLFRVGPVLCATSSLSVQSIISPPKLTHPPGSSPAHPGIFYHAEHVVGVTDLRHQFGTDEAEWTHPGRLIITQADGVYDALWVDDIIEVIETPKEGWGALPPLLPKNIFSRTLLIHDKIHLYTDLRQLIDLEESGVLRQYIQQLSDDPTAISQLANQEDGGGSDKTGISADAEMTRHAGLDATPMTSGESRPPATAKPQTETEAETNGAGTDMPSEDRADAESATTTSEQAAEAGPSEGDAETLVGAHEPEEPATATSAETAEHAEAGPDRSEQAEEPLEHIEAGPERNEEMATEDQIASTEAAGDETTESITPTAIAEHEPVQDQAAPDLDETAPADKPDQPPEDLSQTRTVIDERFIIEDEPDIPLLLDEDSDKDPGTLPPQREPIHEEKSSTGPIIFGLIALLILAGIGAGLYHYLASSDSVVDEQEITTNDEQAEPSETEQAPADTPVITEIKGEEPEENTIEIMQEPPPEATPAATETKAEEAEEKTFEVTEEPSSEPAPAKGYSADIKPDKEGITILLHAPQGETQLRDDSPEEETEKTAKKKSSTKPKEEQNKTHRAKAKTKKKARIEVIHVVAKGDTLWDIAEYYVNDPFRYPELARLSKINNPDLIYPGNRVRIIDTNGER